jgi:hypothetical protein
MDPDLPSDAAARLRARDRKVAPPRMVVDNAGVKRLLLQRAQAPKRRRRKKREP